jgi:allantoate deiminase
VAHVVARCRELAAITEEEGRTTRWFGGAAMARANALVGRWMAEAGMAVRVDGALNLVGSVPGSDPEAGTLLLGSHLDTVRDAGAFDGPLGVIAAIECVERLRAQEVSLPFAVDVIGFSDEEGLRFGTAYLGSRAVAGTLDDAARALIGADADSASRRGKKLLGYVELHIEQGPVLEERDAPVAVVEAIAGATRAEVAFTGRAGHAGTVPMKLRRDAAAALAEFVLAVEAAGRGTPGLVATVGQLSAEPGAPNVIPGRAVGSLDVRHADDATRAAAVLALAERGAQIAARRGLEFAWEERMATAAVEMNPALRGMLVEAVSARGIPLVSLASGAGHDAVVLSELTGTAMLFVRCAGGISHHPDESVDPADVEVAIDVLEEFLRLLATSVV